MGLGLLGAWGFQCAFVDAVGSIVEVHFARAFLNVSAAVTLTAAIVVVALVDPTGITGLKAAIRVVQIIIIRRGVIKKRVQASVGKSV